LLNQNAGTEVAEEKKTYAFGNAALAAKNTHELRYPIRRGIIEDIDSMAQIWCHIFDELNLEPKNVNVLMTDSPFDTKEKTKEKQRAKIAEYLFEELKIKSFAMMNTAALSMYSTGKVSGLIVESGESLSYTVPIFEGYALPHAQI
jgi:actin, other eukaryote